MPKLPQGQSLIHNVPRGCGTFLPLKAAPIPEGYPKSNLTFREVTLFRLCRCGADFENNSCAAVYERVNYAANITKNPVLGFVRRKHGYDKKI